jgi:hypothetical protein
MIIHLKLLVKFEANSVPRVLLIGDAGPLKTRMLFSYFNGEISKIYIPTVFPDRSVTVR